MGFKEDIRIDINNLEIELIRQASLFQSWGKKEAEALYEKDQIEETLKKCRAKIELDIRSDPIKYKYEGRPTEAAISSLLILQPGVVKATNAFLKSKYRTRIFNIAVKSFEHKKKALEKLVELYINGYWATPRVDPEFQKSFDEQAQKIIGKALNKDKRMIKLAKEKEKKRQQKDKRLKKK